MRSQFTDKGLERLNAKKQLAAINERRRRQGLKPLVQFRVHDADPANRGLSLLVGLRSKTFQSTFKYNGYWQTASLGSFGQMSKTRSDAENIQIGEARKRNIQYRALARQGIDPREPDQNPLVELRDTYKDVVTRFINEYAMPRQRTWKQTKRILEKNCKTFLFRPIDKITKREIDELLSGFIAQGHGYKANNTRAWLKKLWRWAYAKDLVSAPIMEGVSIEFERRSRKRVYTDEEIKRLWACTKKLPKREAAFLRVMILLAPRKSELRGMQRSEIGPRKFNGTTLTIWTTPPDRVKQSKRRTVNGRVYMRPLSPFVRSLLPRDELIFKGVASGRSMKKKLAKLNAPDVFKEHADYHAWRHTIATWLETEGYTKEEVAIALTHAATGGATPGYMHGHAIKLMVKMLSEWERHVLKITSSKTSGRKRAP